MVVELVRCAHSDDGEWDIPVVRHHRGKALRHTFDGEIACIGSSFHDSNFGTNSRMVSRLTDELGHKLAILLGSAHRESRNGYS